MSETKPCPHCGKSLPTSTPGGLCPECMLRMGASVPTEWPDETAAGSPGDRRPPPPSPEEMSKHFPNLEILECLGRGGMGVVYKARQPKLDRLVALKVLAPERGSEPKFSERFEREAQTLARLSHPNIVAVHDFGETDGIYYLVMEFVDGRSLRDVLRAGTITPEQALAIVPCICEALQLAHEHGVVHRDIKPENVLLDKGGRVKIADFGIAKLVGDERSLPALTEDRQVIGTPHYMAPEQVEKPQLVDHRADIYSLGVVFYEMLTGELPLGKFAPPSRKVVVDVRLDEVVLRALEKEPEQRYQKASEVKTDLEGIQVRRSGAQSARTPQTRTAISPPPEPKSSKPGPDRSEEAREDGLGTVPRLLWVTVAIMSGAAIWKQVALPDNPSWLWAEALLIAGLVFRFKLAYAATLFFALVGVVFFLLTAPAGLAMVILFLNATVAGLLLRCTNWFFNRNRASGLRPGGDLIAGILFALPPLTHLWFVRGGHGMFEIDLDVDVRFFLGAIGMPVSAAVGAAVVLFAKPWLATRFTTSVQPAAAPETSRQWSMWAAAAAGLLVLSLPLGGGGVVMVDLIREDTRWNPAPAEAVFSLTLGALAIACILGCVALGFEALRRMKLDPIQSRGWLGAVGAAWMWPFLLGTVLLTSSQTARVPTADEALSAARMEQARLEATRSAEAARGFEPVHEIVLLRNSNLQDSFLNLETGRILSAPTGFVQSLKVSGRLSSAGHVQVLFVLDWMRNNGADLFCSLGASGLTLVDGASIPMSDRESELSPFRSASASRTRGAADALAEPLALYTNRQPKGMSVSWFEGTSGTNTWAIRTRSGRAGLLELRSDQVHPDHVRFRYKLVSRLTSPPSAPFLGPSTRRQHLRLFNNAELEIVGVCRNPRNTAEWWRPDGTLFSSPPVEILELPALAATRRPQITVKPENEFLVYARWTLPEGVRIHSVRPEFDPSPSDWKTTALVRDLEQDQKAAAELVSFDTVPDVVTYKAAVSFGPWSAVSVYDLESKTAQDLIRGTMALWSEPRYDTDAKALRYEVMHDVDRRTFALRMTARYRNGRTESLVFHSGVQSGSPTKGFALIHGTEIEASAELANLQELVLERTPWVRCEIPQVVLNPAR